MESHYLDWSIPQVEKHEHEIRSLLGNFYLRLQNETINARLPETNHDIPFMRDILLDASNDGKEGAAVRDKLLSLKGRVHEGLANHDVGEALDEIVDCLNIVRTGSVTSGVLCTDLRLYQVNKDYTDCAPWSTTTSDSTILRLQTFSRETLRIISFLLQPFIPSKSSQLLDALGIPSAERTWSHADLGAGSEQCGPMKRVVLFPSPKGRKRIAIEEEFNTDVKDNRTKAGLKRGKGLHPKT